MSSAFSFCDLATPGVQGLRPYEPGKPLSELEREYGVRDAIKLASNENPLGPSPAALEAARGIIGEIARYPDGNGFELKRAIAHRYGVDMRGITLGNGSNDVLEIIARAFLLPGLESVFSQHAFAVYSIVTQAIGATARVVPANDGSQGPRYGHDLDGMLAAFSDKTRVVFIANPNNPTGTWLKRDELEAFLERVPQQIIVVLDEAYVEYVTEAEYPDSIPWLTRFPNLILTRTFSKAYGLAGLRVGFALSHPEVSDILNRVRQPFNVNILAMAAASVALMDRAHLEASLKLNQSGMQQWIDAMADLGLDYIPSVGNFLCVDVGRPAAPVYEALLHEGVIVRPVANYGLPNHLRITLGLTQENRRAITALRKVLG
ncbi:MAG TPA: histidinol-phosphate transaminase [Gammaproteobacteria bacterium]|nr:histidinol-phosphate transaminase [Gammaproteobacteria bacterium]